MHLRTSLKALGWKWGCDWCSAFRCKQPLLYVTSTASTDASTVLILANGATYCHTLEHSTFGVQSFSPISEVVNHLGILSFRESTKELTLRTCDSTIVFIAVDGVFIVWDIGPRIRSIIIPEVQKGANPQTVEDGHVEYFSFRTYQHDNLLSHCDNPGESKFDLDRAQWNTYVEKLVPQTEPNI